MSFTKFASATTVAALLAVGSPALAQSTSTSPAPGGNSSDSGNAGGNAAFESGRTQPSTNSSSGSSAVTIPGGTGSPAPGGNTSDSGNPGGNAAAESGGTAPN